MCHLVSFVLMNRSQKRWSCSIITSRSYHRGNRPAPTSGRTLCTQAYQKTHSKVTSLCSMFTFALCSFELSFSHLIRVGLTMRNSWGQSRSQQLYERLSLHFSETNPSWLKNWSDVSVECNLWNFNPAAAAWVGIYPFIKPQLGSHPFLVIW